jgi:pimeloyl-ACP methyl ester carboxylesterase
MHKILFFISLLFTFSNLLSAEPITLPKPTGIYAVGTKAFELKDEKRKMFRGEESRRWMIQAFYPAEKHEGTYPYMPETLKNGKVVDVEVLAHAKLNASILKESSYPLIIFVPGLGQERQKYTILCEELASQGYVILSLDQPYVSNFVRFPDNHKITLNLKDAWKLTLGRKDRDYRYRYYDLAMDMIINDIKYILDHMDALNKNHFDSVLNIHQTILMGHSFGGNVAHHLGFKDPRIKAIVDIDSKISDRNIYGHIGIPANNNKKPVFFIRGMMQYQENLGDQLTKIDNATIWTPNVEHSAFTDNAFLAKYIPNLATQSFIKTFLNWFFKSGPNFDAIDTDLGSNSANEWFKDYRSKIVSSLNKTLKDDSHKKFSRSPIGDTLHTDVYNFIIDKLLQEKSYTEQEVNKFIHQDLDILNIHVTDKPFIANLYEGEFADLLKKLCHTFEGCQEITLYQKNGVGIAYTGQEKELKFKEKQDILISLGFLGKNIQEKLGTIKLTTDDGQIYYEIIKAIYYNKERHYAYLEIKKSEQEHLLIGYIRYIIK